MEEREKRGKTDSVGESMSRRYRLQMSPTPLDPGFQYQQRRGSNGLDGALSAAGVVGVASVVVVAVTEELPAPAPAASVF
jgi:2-succinyl-5-enolpyruvyl-6-hydroxy-3-cyclohexene-1-carboxylate synthase